MSDSYVQPSDEVTRESLDRLRGSLGRVVATQERVKHLDHVVQELVVLLELAAEVIEHGYEGGAGVDEGLAEIANACVSGGRLNVDLFDELAERSRLHLRSLLSPADAVKAGRRA